jgi:hypothetical protein
MELGKCLTLKIFCVGVEYAVHENKYMIVFLIKKYHVKEDIPSVPQVQT